MDSDWQRPPPHLLDSVLEKIEKLPDYLQFGDVCDSWNSVAKNNPSQYFKTLSRQFPMLLVPGEDNNTHSIYDVITNDFLNSKLVVPLNNYGFFGSSQGWLVAVEKDCSITLYKPSFMVGGEKTTEKIGVIHLPPAFAPEDRQYYHDDYVFKALITADPVTNPDQCMVMIIIWGSYDIFFIRPAKDTTWTCVDFLQPGYEDILYYNDQFYALTCFGELYSFRITDLIVSDWKLVASKQPLAAYGKNYLVMSPENKFLHVVRVLDWKLAREVEDEDEDEAFLDDDNYERIPFVARLTLKVAVYELDVDEGKWLEINSLGDLALFVGDNSSISILASNFPGCKPNHIYFTHDQDSWCSGRDCFNDIGAYDLESRRTDFHFGGATSSAKKLPIWFVPSDAA